jgi:uncharacterized protein YecE (DUF72 family)
MIHIGTSGWFYGHWDEVFYPKDLKQKDRLAFYSTIFKTVEINSTFYHLPTEKSVKNWHKRVDADFIFSIKISRYLTHMQRLNCDKASVDLFFDRMKPLKKKIGCVLIQLPPSFEADHERLSRFLSMLPKNRRFTVEFRHRSWFTPKTMRLLRKFKAALCISDIRYYPLWLSITTDFVYMRLHGSKRAYKGEYGTSGLRPWVKRIKKWASKRLDIFCYFDNDEKGYAVADAKRIKELLKNS